MAVQVDTMQAQVKNANRATESNSKHVDDLLKEKKELFEKCLASEQALSDVKRDAELKDIKIESLQNIIAKREH